MVLDIHPHRTSLTNFSIASARVTPRRRKRRLKQKNISLLLRRAVSRDNIGGLRRDALRGGGRRASFRGSVACRPRHSSDGQNTNQSNKYLNITPPHESNGDKDANRSIRALTVQKLIIIIWVSNNHTAHSVSSLHCGNSLKLLMHG